jgi:hypothetical protein
MKRQEAFLETVQTWLILRAVDVSGNTFFPAPVPGSDNRFIHLKIKLLNY